jgi:hypothetical protein
VSCPKIGLHKNLTKWMRTFIQRDTTTGFTPKL